MDRETVIARLRRHEDELRTAGIARLAIFGSVARGDATPDSDVDLLIRLAKDRKFSLLTMVSLENRMADIVGATVELAREDLLREPVRVRAEIEAVVVF